MTDANDKLAAPKPKNPGRPRKLTPRLIRRVEQLAAKGLTQRQIGVILNIHEVTLIRWKGGAGDLNISFCKAIEKGQAEGIRRRLDRIEKAAKAGNWAADAWTLERRYPEQFARRDKLALSDPDGKPVAGTTVIAPSVVFVMPEHKPVPGGPPVIDIGPENQQNGGTNGSH